MLFSKGTGGEIMALNNNDEDYLNALLNSIVDGNNSEDDDWFEQELANGGDDISFDDELTDANDDIEIQAVQSNKIIDDSFDEIENESPIPEEESNATQLPESEPDLELESESKLKPEPKMKLESEPKLESEYDSQLEPEPEIEERLEQIIEADESTEDNIDLSGELDTSESDDDMNDILNLINAMENDSTDDDISGDDILDDISETESEENTLEANERKVKRYEDIIDSEQEDGNAITIEEPSDSDIKKKAKSKKLFGKLLSRNKQPKVNDSVEDTDIANILDAVDGETETNKRQKEKKKEKVKREKKKKKQDKSDDNSLIDMDGILEETGSVMDDMDNLGLNDLGLSEEFGLGSSKEMDEDLDEIEEKQSKKKKKEKKPKKEKEPKVPKEKKKKPKKPPVREEIIRITPLGFILSMSVIAAIVSVVYFGAKFSSYNRNIDEATGYYVDKNYTKAYAILSGMDLKKEDTTFYAQVVTIIKVEKYYNEFSTYYKLEMYADALNSLIRGVKNYDIIIDEARELGTFDQATASLGKIIDCLSSYYGMTESEARQLSQMENKVEYSNIIYSKASNVKISEKGTSE